MDFAREYIGERVTKNVFLSLVFLYGCSLVYKGTGLKGNRKVKIYQAYELLETKCISHLPLEGHCGNCFWTKVRDQQMIQAMDNRIQSLKADLDQSQSLLRVAKAQLERSLLRINSHQHEMSQEITAKKRAQESVENMLDEKRLLHQRIKSLTEQYEILMENYRGEIALKINAQESLARTLDEKRVLTQRVKDQAEQYQRLVNKQKRENDHDIALVLGAQDNLDKILDQKGVTKEKELLKKNSCIICYSKVADYAPEPCFHLAYCIQCASRLNECAICRKPIRKRHKIFS